MVVANSSLVSSGTSCIVIIFSRAISFLRSRAISSVVLRLAGISLAAVRSVNNSE